MLGQARDSPWSPSWSSISGYPPASTSFHSLDGYRKAMDIKKPVLGLSVSRKEVLPSPHSNSQPWAVYHRNKPRSQQQVQSLTLWGGCVSAQARGFWCDELTAEQEFSESKNMKAKGPSRGKEVWEGLARETSQQLTCRVHTVTLWGPGHAERRAHKRSVCEHRHHEAPDTGQLIQQKCAVSC